MSIVRPVIASLLIAGMLLPIGAIAQEAAPSRESRLPMELKRRQAIVHPLPDREAIARDAAHVAAALQAAARRDAHVRDTTPRPADRPDLHYDVYSAIQARNLQRAVRQ